MRVALVYDLRDDYRALGLSEEEIAEFDNVDTIDELAGALEALGCEVERVGRGQALAARFVEGERFDLVFSIAEGVKGRSREAQVAGAVRAVRPALPLLRPADDGRLPRQGGGQASGPRCRRAHASLRRGADERKRARRLGAFPGLREAARRRHRQGMRGSLARGDPTGARSGGHAGAHALCPARAGRGITWKVASSPSASSATAPRRACSASARSC